MKRCNRCKTEKPLDCFGKDRTSRDGLFLWCKSCRSSYNKLTVDRTDNARRVSAWKKANPTKHSIQRKKYRIRHWDAIRLTERRYYELHSIKWTFQSGKRRAALLNAMPIWLTIEQSNEILDIYEKARILTEINGRQYHVDHIIPLLGKNVRGLHVPWNLQILPAKDNLSKNNKWIQN